MSVTLTKPRSPVLNGTIEVRAEWNHSCTSQCPNPCPASSRFTGQPVMNRIPQQPGPQTPRPGDTPKIPQQPGPNGR